MEKGGQRLPLSWPRRSRDQAVQKFYWWTQTFEPRLWTRYLSRGKAINSWDFRIRFYLKPHWTKPFTRRIYRICPLCPVGGRLHLLPICLTVNQSLPCCLRCGKNSTSSSLT